MTIDTGSGGPEGQHQSVPKQNGSQDRLLVLLLVLVVAGSVATLYVFRSAWWPDGNLLADARSRNAATAAAATRQAGAGPDAGTTQADAGPDAGTTYGDAGPAANTRQAEAAAAATATAAAAGTGGVGPGGTSGETSAYVSPTLAPAPTLAPEVGRLLADPPGRDLVELAARMGRTSGLASRTADRADAPYTVGDTESFWVHDIVAERYFEVTARLEVVTDNAYFWVQDGFSADLSQLTAGAEEFSSRVVPAVRENFGSEWNPGIDADPRMHVLHHQPIAGIAGYYSSADQFVTAVEPHSNEREMFYINMEVYTPGSFDWLALLAHEFQHMVHWHADPDEPVWANEGLSELATTLAGYPAASASAFIARPDTPLLEWNVDPGQNVPDYAASFAFMTYLHGQFGADGIRRIVRSEGNGPKGIEQGLAGLAPNVTFDDLFLDWTVANAIDDPTFGGGRFSYLDTAIGPVRAESLDLAESPNQVFPYGTDYYDATRSIVDGRLEIDFDGADAVGLLQPDATSADALWWSNRGDSSDSRLARAFDLTGASQARLDFRLFYELEPNWDYAYFMASTDGGATWERLATERTTDLNPNGNNYGNGLTGSSGTWVDESIDLTPYAGRPILFQFEVITDDAVNLMGVGLDDIRLEAIGFADDATSDQGWRAEGWLRSPATVPVRWSPQVIVHDTGGILGVHRPTVSDGTATFVVEDVPAGAGAIVAVSQVTRPVRHPVSYTMRSVRQAPYP